MPIIIQDDSGSIQNANSYVSLAYVDAYFVEKNDVSWGDLDQEVKEAALISATRYFDNVNYGKIKGIKLTKTQNTQFPRDAIFDEDGDEISGIPENLKMAICEYAIRAVSNSLAPDPNYNDNGLFIKSFREKTGPLDEMTVYQDANITPSKTRSYPEADMLVERYKKQSGFLVRA